MLVGNAQTGKSSLVSMFTKQEFRDEYYSRTLPPWIGVKDLDRDTLDLEIVDTSGLLD